MKNKFLVAVMVVILFIPTVVAFISYNPPFTTLAESPNMIQSAVIEPTGITPVTINEKAKLDVVSKFLLGEQVQSIPEEVLMFPMFKITLNGKNTSETYSVYMNLQKMNEIYYYNTADEVPYRIPTESGRAFAALNEAAFLYTWEIPTLTVGGVKIDPCEFSWRYKNIKDEYVQSEVPVTEEVKNIGTVYSGDLGILFSRKPLDADVYVTVTPENGESVKRPFAEFTGVYPNETTKYTFEIEVQWREEDGVNGVGNGKYRFACTVKASADFKIWTTTLEITGQPYVEKGGVAVLAARNTDVSKLKFESSPKLCESPKFYTIGDVSYAIIPTTYATNPGTYEVSLEYGEKRSTYTITVTDREYNDKNFSLKSSTIEKYITEENVNALKTLISSVCEYESYSEWHAEDKMLFPTERQDYKTGYGNPIYFRGEKTEYFHIGIDSRLYKGDSATAMASGKIVFAAESEIWGGVVVIDHGCGVRSWYARLDVSDVTVGDEVKQGDEIAKGDESGFGEDDRIHCSVSVGDVFVSPLWLIENGIQLPTWE